MRPSLFLRQDAFGNLVRDAVLENPPVADRGGAPAIGADYYELERLATSFIFDTGRSEFSLGGGRTERIYADALNDTSDTTLHIGLSRELSPRTYGYLNLGGVDHEEILVNYKQWVITLGGSFQPGEALELGFRLAHLERDAEIEIFSYEENSFNLYLSATF
jgi:hypothetical protein